MIRVFESYDKLQEDDPHHRQNYELLVGEVALADETATAPPSQAAQDDNRIDGIADPGQDKDDATSRN
jgi:hypothetical protein